MNSRLLTTDELAALIRTPADVVLELLEDERNRGHVLLLGDRWRLTDEAEQRHGRDLRDIDRPA